MNNKHKYLTKSRFTLALQCPTKLYYLNKPNIYANRKNEDEFLEALAEGGYQVGELAKYYYPGGTDIKTLDYDLALQQTNDLLNRQNAIIYEAAVLFKDFFIRVDILKKTGDVIELIEVKAKSFNPDEDSLINKKGYLDSNWLPYLQDVAFQTWVTEQAFPDYKVIPYLILTDKSARTTVNGLNQIFRIKRNQEGRKEVFISVPEISKDVLGEQILISIPVRNEIDKIFSGEEKDPAKKSTEELKPFIHRAEEYARFYKNGQKYPVEIGSKCKDCEFVCDKIENVLKSGFNECWRIATDGKYNPDEEHIFNIWDYRKKDKLIFDGKYHIKDIEETDIKIKADPYKPGLSKTERQWIQVNKVKTNDTDPYFDMDGFINEMSGWTFPLHFIDFETSMVSIPFTKCRSPYEGIAFQWSHHMYNEDGSYEHKGQFLNTERGHFPNFDFIRALKKELEKDNGTVFRYANHENVFLNNIYKQLFESPEEDISDRIELMDWIKTITHSGRKSVEQWEGVRDMVDMCELVKKYYYHPDTHGSNSIKAVLPAILKSSEFLQEKYLKPFYGTKEGIKSLNYHNWCWIEKDENGLPIDPYKLLPPLFKDVENVKLDDFIVDDMLSGGGAAMMAYAKLQFSDITKLERKKVEEGLLRYCELDTLAMVMIFEYWKNLSQ